MSKKYDYAVFVGRFQPVHNGHLNAIKQALEIADKLIVVCGSAYKPRDPKNPWTVAERFEMIQGAIESVIPEDANRVHYTYCYDYVYNDTKWLEEVQRTVHSFIPPDKEHAICLVGHHKDDTSYYLDLFPNWKYFEIDDTHALSATDIRKVYLQEGRSERTMQAVVADIVDSVPQSVYEYLENFYFEQEDAYEQLSRESDLVFNYKRAWKDAPYPPIFVTADAVVVYSGHILMVTRGAAPGEGTLALPGGFIDPAEDLQDAAIRELREETKLKVPVDVLKGSIKAKEVFAYPHRSLRGRTITHAYLFDITRPGGNLPKVRGSDDAVKAQWILLSDINKLRNKIFEDHADIIENMVARI